MFRDLWNSKELSIATAQSRQEAQRRVQGNAAMRECRFICHGRRRTNDEDPRRSSRPPRENPGLNRRYYDLDFSTNGSSRINKYGQWRNAPLAILCCQHRIEFVANESWNAVPPLQNRRDESLQTPKRIRYTKYESQPTLTGLVQMCPA